MGNYQKSNFSWQLQRWLQNGREWLDLQLHRLWGNFPNLEPPTVDDWQWWESLIFNGLLWFLIALAIAMIWWNRRTLGHYWSSLMGVNLSLPNRPTMVETSQHWRKLAHQSGQQGDYYQACRYLYLALLQTLQDQGLVPQTPARTDQEYLQLLRHLPQAEQYHALLQIHQDLCFGHQPASWELFETCQRALRAIAKGEK